MRKLITLTLTVTATLFYSCTDSPMQKRMPSSESGVTKATVKVETDLNGHTSEQNNIIERYKEDNRAGAIKHLYIISAYSGQVLIYSTVKGKVTSSGKRLNPVSVIDNAGQYIENTYGFKVSINNEWHRTNEVLQDDGTYGSSVEYIYWWDSKNIYHQQYITGGMILHVSNEPIAAKSVIMNFETAN